MAYRVDLQPVSNIRKPSPGERRNRRLSGREQATLLAAGDEHTNPMLGWIVRLGIETGMRQSEILGLRRGQVDLERRVVRLTDTKNNDARTAPLTKLAASVLQSALADPVRPIDTDLVFFGEPGRDKKRRAYEPKFLVAGGNDQQGHDAAKVQCYLDSLNWVRSRLSYLPKLCPEQVLLHALYPDAQEATTSGQAKAELRRKLVGDAEVSDTAVAGIEELAVAKLAKDNADLIQSAGPIKAMATRPSGVKVRRPHIGLFSG